MTIYDPFARDRRRSAVRRGTTERRPSRAGDRAGRAAAKDAAVALLARLIVVVFAVLPWVSGLLLIGWLLGVGQ